MHNIITLLFYMTVVFEERGRKKHHRARQRPYLEGRTHACTAAAIFHQYQSEQRMYSTQTYRCTCSLTEETIIIIIGLPLHTGVTTPRSSRRRYIRRSDARVYIISCYILYYTYLIVYTTTTDISRSHNRIARRIATLSAAAVSVYLYAVEQWRTNTPLYAIIIRICT